MSTLSKRERITAKDIGAVMGLGRTKSFEYLRQLKMAKIEQCRQFKKVKKQRVDQAQVKQQFYVYVDDLVKASGLSREVIKAALK